MTAQHTLGPYRYRREEHLIVTDGEGMLGKLHIAEVCPQAEDTDANGHLLAAAPLMLEALMEARALLIDAHDRGYAIREVEPVFNALSDAIRAATGEDA